MSERGENDAQAGEETQAGEGTRDREASQADAETVAGKEAHADGASSPADDSAHTSAEPPTDEQPDAASISRRSALAAVGLAGLLGFGATSTASADPQGQIGTQSDPLQTLYVEAIESATVGSELTIGGGGDRVAALRPRPSYDTVDVVFGHHDNSVSNYGGTVAGGGTGSNPNTAAEFAAIGGGQGNVASSRHATIGGGFGHSVTDTGATVGGGIENTASYYESTIGGGRDNVVSSNHATIAGGSSNEASSSGTTIGGGEDNTASSYADVVAGGSLNTASGGHATVPGGWRNTASGAGSLAAGVDAAADWANAFVWNDGSEYSSQNDFRAGEAVSGEPVAGNETFNVSASGGVRFVTGGSSVTYIESGTAGWSNTSTRTAKTNVEATDPEQILQGVESLEVATWEYRAENDTTDDDGTDAAGTGSPRIGPFAEEFHDAFDVGGSESHINSIDVDGVALAAIQGLSARLEDREERIDRQAERVDDLESENDALRDRLTAIEDRLDGPTEAR